MKRVICAFLMCLAAPQVAADTAVPEDLILKRIVRAFDLRPLPIKPFGENPKYRLGRALFFDPILSGNRDISCATCHLLTRGTSDAQPHSIGTGGVGLGEERTLPTERGQQPRNALDLWNRDNNSVRRMFWDGRVELPDPSTRLFRSPLGNRLPEGLDNLMAVQALFPLAREDEMLGVPGDRSPSDLPALHADQKNELAADTAHLRGAARIEAVHGLIMKRLLGGQGVPVQPWQTEYRALFQSAYPDLGSEEFSIVEVGNALSHFEEIAFATRQTPWDAYLSGEVRAIDDKAKRGAVIFFGKGRCVACHNGPLFSDFEFHAIGVKNTGPGWNETGDDKGRYRVTGRTADQYRFRTPPLRNVTLTAPYFHNGSAATLRGAILQHLDPYAHADQYEETGAFAMNVEQIEAISPVLGDRLLLSGREFAALLAFLYAVEDGEPDYVGKVVPPSVPSGLPVSTLAVPPAVAP